MTTHDWSNDPVLASLAVLRPYDVQRARITRLRRRCHAALQSTRSAQDRGASRWIRTLGPAVTGAWCVAYVFETVRRAAAFYRF